MENRRDTLRERPGNTSYCLQTGHTNYLYTTQVQYTTDEDLLHLQLLELLFYMSTTTNTAHTTNTGQTLWYEVIY